MTMQKKDQMHPEDRRNLIIFALCAMMVWFSYEQFLIKPKIEARRQAEIARKEWFATNTLNDPTAVKRPRAEVLTISARLPFGNRDIAGSIALTGGRIDDLSLLKYARELHGKERVELLSPTDTDYPLYAEFGWVGQDGDKTALPGPSTVWQVAGGATRLTPAAPVTLFWENGQGLRFERRIALDDHYMFTITQRVVNTGKGAVTLHPYGRLREQGMPEEYRGKQIHEGPISYIDGELKDITFAKMIKNGDTQEMTGVTGWIGLTELYWFASIIPQQGEETRYRFLHTAPPTVEGRHAFQVDTVGAPRIVQPGATAENSFRIFAGAKEVKQLEAYEKAYGIPHFDLAVDFGRLYFLTKPLFHILHFFYTHVGNMGIAIVMLTVLVRLCVFPLANISFRSFAKLRRIAPQMKELRETYSDDKARLQQELVKLYEREKVNPMAGCLPILVQIPIFFALFKVMVITIELRHAPFFGWIHDLSAADPTSVFNLFGLIPWTPPEPLMIGAWPCMMMVFMLLQRNMNPPAQDKAQQMMINLMPFFITYIMHRLAAGLVVYYTFSNALSILQQYVIMRSMGVEVHFFRRPKVEQELEKQVAEQPAIHPEAELLEEKIEEAMFGGDAPTVSETGDVDKGVQSGPRKNPAAKKKRK